MRKKQKENGVVKMQKNAIGTENTGAGILKKSHMAGILLAAVVCAAGAFRMDVEAAIPGDLWQYTEGSDGEGNIFYDFKEVEVVLPESWEGKYGMAFGEDFVNFYHRASREKMQAAGWGNGGGTLFTVRYSQNYDFTDYLTNYYIVDSGELGVYYVTLPTDAQGYPEDEQVWKEWLELYDDVEWVRDQVSVIYLQDGSMDTLDGIDSGEDMEGEYILEDSSVRYLDMDELYGMDVDELQMAINEIYARHHRKFVIKDIQEYFNTKSWYSGTVEAEDFDPAVMNQYEGQNIELMLKRMRQLKKNK